jgi:two-component system, NarL family, nitrate/nitrite response regulator NarL
MSDVAVLTVDDQRVFREAAHDVIESTEGFTSVGEVGSAHEALAAIEEERPELVLVDVRMPGVDGIELTQRIKRAHPKLVVALISMEEPTDLPAELSTSGAEAFMSKQEFGPSALENLWLAHGK